MDIISQSSFLFKLIRASVRRQKHPLVATISVTGRCNARCLYCFGEYQGNDSHRELSTDQLLDLIDELIGGGTAFIAFTGGEPLLRADIGILIDRVKSRGCICTLDTNGFLLPERIGELGRVDSITVSLDGDQVSHDAARGKGSYIRTIKGIEATLNSGIDVELGAVLNRGTIDSIDFLVEFSRSNGMQIKFYPLRYFDKRWKDPPYSNLIPSGDELRSAFQKLKKLKENGAPIRYSNRGIDYILNWPDYSRFPWPGGKPDFPYVRCRAGRLRCFIEHDGGVYPCCDIINYFQAQNYLEVGLTKALRHATQSNTCRACYFPSHIEQNLLVNLDWRTILSNIRSAFR